jgi:hypothetical protein
MKWTRPTWPVGFDLLAYGIVLLLILVGPGVWRIAVRQINASQNQIPAVDFSASSDELERRDQPVTEADLKIIQRADTILSSPAVWNRHDTRECRRDDKTWSLFCAMEQASLDILGEYRHRDVALQEVRFAVEDATKGIEFEHRMMDYNNLANTTFDDIKNILSLATRRVSNRLKAQEAGK